MFRVVKEEWQEILKCQFVTSSPSDNLKSQFVTLSWGGTRKLPYAFTKQGIYMLMTVLRGELATKQSKALIRLFKRMKDYIVGSNNLLTTGGILELSNQVMLNTKEIDALKKNNKEIKKKLTKVMDNFIDPSRYKYFLILDGQKIEMGINQYGLSKIEKKAYKPFH